MFVDASATTSPPALRAIASTRVNAHGQSRVSGGPGYRSDLRESAPPPERAASAAPQATTAPGEGFAGNRARPSLLPTFEAAAFVAQRLAQETLPPSSREKAARLGRGYAAYRGASGDGVAVVGPWRNVEALI